MSRIFEFRKVIRDKIKFPPEVRVNAMFLDAERLGLFLKMKLVEEVSEVFDAVSNEELIEELADIEEVLAGIKRCYGLDDNAIELKRLDKFKERGGFYEGRYISTVEVPEGHSSLEYYTKRPDRYPEVTENAKC